jgi:hypothetical protein
MAMLDIAMILRLLEKAAGDHPVCCPS